MIITDMRMESDESGHEVIQAARTAPYHPAVALLTAFPVEDDDWEQMGADKLLLKPMHTRVLLEQIDQLFSSHERKLAAMGANAAPVGTVKLVAPKKSIKKAAKKIVNPAVKKAAVKVPLKTAGKKAAPKKAVKKAAPNKKTVKKPVAKKVALKKSLKTSFEKTASKGAKRSAKR
jgi:DNA-binding response OmpR family regulator